MDLVNIYLLALWDVASSDLDHSWAPQVISWLTKRNFVDERNSGSRVSGFCLGSRAKRGETACRVWTLDSRLDFQMQEIVMILSDLTPETQVRQAMSGESLSAWVGILSKKKEDPPLGSKKPEKKVKTEIEWSFNFFFLFSFILDSILESERRGACNASSRRKGKKWTLAGSVSRNLNHDRVRTIATTHSSASSHHLLFWSTKERFFWQRWANNEEAAVTIVSKHIIYSPIINNDKNVIMINYSSVSRFPAPGPPSHVSTSLRPVSSYLLRLISFLSQDRDRLEPASFYSHPSRQLTIISRNTTHFTKGVRFLYHVSGSCFCPFPSRQRDAEKKWSFLINSSDRRVLPVFWVKDSWDASEPSLLSVWN